MNSLVTIIMFSDYDLYCVWKVNFCTIKTDIKCENFRALMITAVMFLCVYNFSHSLVIVVTRRFCIDRLCIEQHDNYWCCVHSIAVIIVVVVGIEAVAFVALIAAVIIVYRFLKPKSKCWSLHLIGFLVILKIFKVQFRKGTIYLTAESCI